MVFDRILTGSVLRMEGTKIAPWVASYVSCLSSAPTMVGAYAWTRQPLRLPPCQVSSMIVRVTQAVLCSSFLPPPSLDMG